MCVTSGGDLQSDRDRRGRVISVLPRSISPSTLPLSSFGTMEALSVDMGRIKSGEVNLGVRFPDIATSTERLIGGLVHYLDIDYGRPVQG